MPSQSDLRFSFEALAGRVEFEVVSFELDEAISAPFQLHLELISFDADVDFGLLLDKPVLFTVWRGEQPLRHVHGLVSSFSQGETGRFRTHYHALVEPQLARARLRSNWRIFQHKTVPQIIELMLQRQGINRFAIKSLGDHQVREFCVQAGETDLDFIARLAAEEGFVYRFEHTPQQHRLVITDRLLAFGTINRGAVRADDPQAVDEGDIGPDHVLYHANSGGDQAVPCLRRLRYSEQVRSTRQVQRDYTFTHPRYRQEHRAADSSIPHQTLAYERFDYPGRYKRDAVGVPFTATRLAALRHDAHVAEVQGDDVRLQPGLSFTLVGHPRADLNVHWRPIRVHHQGVQFTSLQEEAGSADQGTRYVQRAMLVPGTREWRPAPLAKPRIDGPHMATVVGPPGEEIYCDEWGRVKVSFPWDRESKGNEFSSCWVRVSQSWAGGSWGSMAIPRIGQDVIIQYVNADPDQPLIIGRTYCGDQLPPYDLPEHKTRMTIKSQTHKGNGFNELRFEDELGREEVFIHAQRDYKTVVGNDETTRVGRNRLEQVGNDQQLSIGNHYRQETGGNHNQFIGQNCQVEIKHDLTHQVGNNRSEATLGCQQVLVGKDSALVVQGAQRVEVGNGMQQRTTVYQLHASERIELKTPGGCIVLDRRGITLNGQTLNLMGQTQATAQGAGSATSLTLTPNAASTCEGKL